MPGRSPSHRRSGRRRARLYAEALREAARPYFREGAVEPGRAHFGLGLYICKTLCERHGGWLSWCNRGQGGARVTAKFLCTTES
ncbi:ATP-binding protein [Paenibacillus macerans]|uniref:ATP-binding protein n=1 Tax=Paenibacillus macerans TaxID=44252 RepID=UPI00398FE4BA